MMLPIGRSPNSGKTKLWSIHFAFLYVLRDLFLLRTYRACWASQCRATDSNVCWLAAFSVLRWVLGLTPMAN